MNSNVQEFVDAFLEFAETARSNAGYDERQHQRVRAALQALGPMIQRSGSVPLVVANIFVDLYGAIESASYRHGEEVAQKLRYAADDLAGIARELTFSPDT